MSNLNKDLPAFPCVNNYYCQEGLTKREYFAAKAMQGLLSTTNLRDHDCKNITKHAINQADSILIALSKE